MKRSHNFNFQIVVTSICIIAFCGTASNSVALAQDAWPNSLFPPLELPQEDGDAESEEKSKSLFPSISALSAGNEEDRMDKFSKSAPAFEKMFEPVLSPSRRSLVTVRSTGASKSRRAKKRQIALGVIVSDEGWVITKASELKGDLYCEMASGEVIRAEIIGLDPEYDFALLKLADVSLVSQRDTDSSDQTASESRAWGTSKWAKERSALTGDWLATPLDHDADLQVGVVSVDSRPIPPSKPFIGISMRDGKPTGAQVAGVQAQSPASSAGLQDRDVILKLDDHVIKDSTDIRKKLEQYDAGDLITLTVVRNEQQKSIKLTLANRDKVSSENMRSNQQNSMGTRLSGRRKDFPTAFQHDTTLQAKECGGPIVNVDGEIVGINIARAGRVASLAIPADKVLEIVDRLGTGEFTPEVVNAKRIGKVDREIRQTEKYTIELANKIKELKIEKAEKALEMPGYQAFVEEMSRKFEALKKETETRDGQLQESAREVSRMKKLVKELEKERLRLARGVK